MHTREDFIAAIRAEPKCDTLRLVYADWLDEFGDCDRDAATAEYIRLTCDRCGRRQAPPAANKWLYTGWQSQLLRREGEDDHSYWMRHLYRPRHEGIEVVSENWKRLVPALVRAHTTTAPLWATRTGQRVEVFGEFVFPSIRRAVGRLTLKFARGFVDDLTLPAHSRMPYLAPLLMADQPLCERARKLMEARSELVEGAK